MQLSVRQSILRAIVGLFLLGNFLLAAVLWHSRANMVMCFAATGVLVAEPMLLAVWLGFARQPLPWRLAWTLGLSAVGSTAYALGVAAADRSMSFGVYLVFPLSGIGATVLAGGFFRAQRFLAGVLSVAEEPLEPASAPESLPESSPEVSPDASSEFSPAVNPEAAPPSSRELQFGVGFVIAMTSAIAMMMGGLRWLAAAAHGPSWAVIFLFGWTYFVYSMLAALIILLSVLATRRRSILAPLAIAYTLLAPQVTLPIINAGGVDATRPEHFINLYAYCLGLSLTLVLVAYILRHLGYRFRHGWL